MAVGGTAAMATVANGGAVTISFSVAGSATAPSDVIQNVKKGDMYVAVPAGSYPWTAEGGWVTDIRADVCGPKEWPAEPCGDFDASLIFAQDGVYEIFFVKYLGVSEFGTDKGYGSDFMRLPQRVCVGSADCNAAPPPAPPPTPPPPPAPSGGDSCPYANDGECDEPTYCQSGTDRTDCAGFLIELNSQEDHWGESGVKLAPLKKKRLLKKEESGVKLAPLKKKRLLKKMFR
jgi:hypothetical protein